MRLQYVLIRLVELCYRHARFVFLTGVVAGLFAVIYATGHLTLDSETDHLFAPDLPWRQRAAAFKADFPQFQNLLVAVIDAREPEEAEATADALSQSLSADPTHFLSVRRPDGSPFFRREGLLFLDRSTLETTLDRIVDAQPFLGELARDPGARGLFATFTLLGQGVERGADLEPYRKALVAFHDVIAGALAGRPQPLSWARLLAEQAAEAGGKYKFVLMQPRLDFGELQLGAAAIGAIRGAANRLEFVKSRNARVRITGNIALADEEFATATQGVVTGLTASTVLISLWLYLAVRTWRLVVPILLTLGLGLTLTLLFAALTVGTLNVISVGFSILFVGIAVDFAIQFCVRYRDMCRLFSDARSAVAETGRRAGGQILIASLATAAGFLSFLPTDFRGVAELGLIAGSGMLVACFCTMTFLPAAVALFRPARPAKDTGFGWAAPLDRTIRAYRRPVLVLFAAAAAIGLTLLPRIGFDANPLHTKDPTTEAMQTLEELRGSPVANPFTADIVTGDADSAEVLATQLRDLPSVANALSIRSFIPQDQDAKLAVIADARNLLRVSLARRGSAEPFEPEQIRASARLASQEVQRALSVPRTDPILQTLADDLSRLAAAPNEVLGDVDRMVSRFLPLQLDSLRDALEAEPVTLQTIPPEIARDWLLPDGRARIQVLPKVRTGSSRELGEFVADVRAVAPGATGPAAMIAASSATILGSFRAAAVAALVSITLMLVIVLRRLIDVLLVLAPLLLSSLMTVIALVLLPLPLNYANIIVLPLLLGIGVSFNIYFVMNWRAGQTVVLASATARAILFSALTTGSAFGSLALSRHPGTASMGELLLISLGFTLMASLSFLPALLASWQPKIPADDAGRAVIP